MHIYRAEDDNSDTRKVLLFVCMEIWWRSVTDSETGIFVFCKMRIVTMFITIDGHLVYFSSTLPLTNISQGFITIWYFSSTLPLTNICFSLHVDLLQSQSPTISMHIHCLALRFKFCARILGCAHAVARSSHVLLTSELVNDKRRPCGKSSISYLLHVPQEQSRVNKPGEDSEVET